MKVAIIGTVGIPANYGGFETLADQLVENKQNPKLQYTVYCSSSSYKQKLKEYKGAELEYVPLKANGSQSIPYDIISLIKASRKHDAILILGVSGAIVLPIFRLFSKKKLITNIDGLEHRRDKWSPAVRKFLKLSEKLAVKYSDEIVADNKAILDYVKDEYGINANLIAYGGDHVLCPLSEEDALKVLDEYNVTKDAYSLGICRIEPENNVEMILEAYSRTPDRKLIFFGNWNHSDYSKALKEKFSGYGNLNLADALYDIRKMNVLRANCNIYLHGHSAGGTNPSLVEAMFFKLPIFAFDCVYNRETTENRAEYFNSAEDLMDLLNNASNLESNADAMQEIAQRRYCWVDIALAYENLMV